MAAMTLVRVWRRQLFAAYGAALIVPCAMLAALIALALGGGFSQLGVLGQIFAGPPVPSAGGLAGTGGGSVARGAAASIPLIPLIPVTAGRRVATGLRVHRGGSPAAPAPAPRTGIGSSGGAIVPGVPGTQPIRTPTHPAPGASQPPAGGSTGSSPGSGAPPPGPSPSPQPAPGPSPSPQPAPGPNPSPQPTPVDQVVQVVTSVTSQVPGPVGSTATQAVQSVGNAAGNVLPGIGSPPGSKLP
jgi:hypothetical protein